jgi:hypothetical protein
VRLPAVVRRPEVLVVVTVVALAVAVEVGWRVTADPAAETTQAQPSVSTSVTAPTGPAPTTPAAKPSTRRPPAAAPARTLHPTPSTPTTTSTPAPPPAPADPGPGGAWPGAGNTGWQHTGVQLSSFACKSDVTEITGAGTVIDGKDIRCAILIRADNVTVKRSRVTASFQWAVRTADGVRGFQIVDSEIVGQPGCEAGLTFTNWTGIRLNIHGCSDGARAEGNVLLQDSWIHGLYGGGGGADPPHKDGVQATGSSNVVIRHNRIENPSDQTSVILVGGENGVPSNWLIERNYLDGGNYTIYLDPNGSNRIIRNNTFSRRFVYGPANLAGQYVFEGNRFADGAPVKP